MLTALLGAFGDTTKVPFVISGDPLTPVSTILVLGRDGFKAYYRLHNDGPDVIDVQVVGQGEAAVVRRNFALGVNQTVDISMGAEDLKISLPDGGKAKGFFHAVKP